MRRNILKLWDRNMSGLLALLAALLAVGVASAHNVELLRSTPDAGTVVDAAPEIVEAWFNEELKTGASTIGVFDMEGNQVDLGDGGVNLEDPYHASMVARLPALTDGAFQVRWHVVLLDDDPTDGHFVFYVGEKSALPAGMAESAIDVLIVPEESGSSLPVVWIVAGALSLVLAGIVCFLLLRGRKRSELS